MKVFDERSVDGSILATVLSFDMILKDVKEEVCDLKSRSFQHMRYAVWRTSGSQYQRR